MLCNQKNIYSKTIFLKPFIVILQSKNLFLIKGPLGFLFLTLPTSLFFWKKSLGFQLVGSITNQNLVLTYHRLFCQKIRGVEVGFFEMLIIDGIGWRVTLNKNILNFLIGYSHPVQYMLPLGIEVIMYDKQHFKIFGLDLNKVKQVVADLCRLRLFNIYKGKGIYRSGKIFKLKESSKSKA